MKKKFLSIIIACFLAVYGFTGNAIPVSANSESSSEAIIILKTDTITELRLARKIIKKKGGTIRNVFPPSVLIAEIPLSLKNELEKIEIIETLSYEKIEPALFTDHTDPSFLNAVNFWNQKKDTTSPSKRIESTQSLHDMKSIETEAIVPSDLPKSKAERIKNESNYKKKWQERKKKFIQEDRQKRMNRLHKQNKSEAQENQMLQSAIGYAPGIAPMTNELESQVSGAGIYDTSDYLIGDIAVSVFFLPGSNGGWTSAEIDSNFQTIVSGLNQLIAMEPNAHLSFTFIKEVDNSGIPKAIPPDSPSKREYLNDVRNIYSTHWAFMISIENSFARASADLNGPSFRLYTPIDARTVRHETMHIFGAMDQYYPDAIRSPIDTWGYLNVVNANAQYNDGKGFFSGAGEGQDDMMVSSSNILGAYTRGQIGWRDTDGDGILDPQDTVPTTKISNVSGNNPYTVSGQSVDQPLPTELNPNTFNSVSVNQIKNVEFRINQGAWTSAQASDGAFDSGIENFNFTTPALPNGLYVLEVRAVNSVGNTQTVYATTKIIANNSAVTNTPAVASLTVSPDQGSTVETHFLLDGSSSRDLQDAADQLVVRWDFESDGQWDTNFSTEKQISRSFSTPGTKTITMEVKDTQGAVSTVSKSIEVTPNNLVPVASFTVTPENQHGDNFNTFHVTLDANASADAEDSPDSLLTRWDFESDGVWDTPYSATKQIQHDYPLSQKFQSFFINTPGNVSVHRISSVGNYLYLSGNPFTVIDISNLTTPTIAGTLTLPGFPSHVAVSGNYAYVTDNQSSLHVIDISNPANPRLISSHVLPIAPFGVAVSGNYAYVADRGAGLVVVNVSNPTAPNTVGIFNTPGDAQKVFILNQYAYVADGLSGLQILNISDPNNLVFTGTVDTPGAVADVYVKNNYAYVADSQAGLQVIDVSVPSSPQIIGNYNTPGQSYGIYVSGNKAFVGDWNQGISVVDLSDPTHPVLSYQDIDAGTAIFGITGNSQNIFAANGTRVKVLNLTQTIPAPITKTWKATLEIKDTSENISTAQRNVWAVTYNNPPTLTSIEASDTNGVLIETLGTYLNNDTIRNIFVSHPYLYMLYSQYNGQSYSGLKIFDISDPVSPMPVGGTYFSAGSKAGIFISGHYAYITEQITDKGLKIIDIADINNPVLVGTYPTPLSADNVKIYGNYAYLMAGSLYILDVSNPTNPILKGTYANGTGSFYDVLVKNNYAYLAGTGGLDIIDISNPANPSAVGNTSYNLSRIIDIEDRYLYTSGLVGFSGEIKIFDIIDPHTPTLLGTYSSPHTIWSALKWENFILVGNGFFPYFDIIDVSDVRNLKFISRYSGAYSATMTLSQGLIYTSDISATKEIFTLKPTLGKLAKILSSQDPDFNTSWDGLLEYRWDFDNDGSWDTKYDPTFHSVVFPRLRDGQNIVCEIKDRFHATAKTSLTLPPLNGAPVLNPIGNKSTNEGTLLAFTLSGSDPDSDPIVFTASSLPPGASLNTLTGAFTWTPAYNQAGNYTIIFSVSDGALSDQKTAAISVVNVPKPDLIVSSISAPAATVVAPGGVVSIANAIANQGTASSTSSVVDFHLSTDAVYGGANDIVINNFRSVGPLGIGATNSAKGYSLTVPTTTPSGNYYLCAKADSADMNAEENESNNTLCSSLTLTVAPSDILMKNVSGSTQGLAGGLVSITATVQALAGNSGNFSIGYYLSTDNVITTNDIFLGSQNVANMKPTTTASYYKKMLIPTSLPAGTYYLGSIADYTNAIVETNETNNALPGNTILISAP